MFFQKADVTIRYKDTIKGRKYEGVMLLKKEPDYLILCKNPEEFVRLCMCDYSLGQKTGNGCYDSYVRFIRQTLEFYVEDRDNIRSTTIRDFLRQNAIVLNLEDILFSVDSKSIETIEQLKST